MDVDLPVHAAVGVEFNGTRDGHGEYINDHRSPSVSSLLVPYGSIRCGPDGKSPLQKCKVDLEEMLMITEFIPSTNTSW